MKRFDIPDAVERYLAGESVKSIAESHGVSREVIERRLAEAKVRRTVQDAQRLRFGTKPVDDSEIARLYEKGSSENALSLRFGVSRALIRNILAEKKVVIRGRSEAASLRMSQMGKEGRLGLTQAAHASVRGVPHSEEQRAKVAASRQRLMTQASPIEMEFAESLRGRGVVVVQQFAVGRYNVDLALAESPIAVEVFGGRWHASGRHGRVYRKRIDYLLDRGWTPVVVWCTSSFPSASGAVDYIIALHEAVRSGEPQGREEHVIRGDGEGGPVSQGYPSGVPVIACYKGGADPRGDDPRPR